MPEVEAAAKPTVNLTARSNTGRSAYSSNNGQSALDLLKQSRKARMSVAPVATQIWVQVGAFHSESSAASVLAHIETLGNGEISSLLRAG